jgi:4,5-dihydroxyphthalate decarboxylase
MITKLSLAIRPYDGVLPITRGEICIPGVDLQVREMTNVPRLFEGFFRGEYEISEMSLAEAVHYISHGQAEFACIPVFPSRIFRFGYLFANVASGVTGPASVNGRRVGFQRWIQTAGVWMRGQLVDEYGVSPSATEWYVRTIYHWNDADHSKVAPRNGSTIRFLDLNGDAQAETAYMALLEGKVDVMGVTENQLPCLLRDRRVRRLFPNYQQEDAGYYHKTRIFPIMHVLCVQSAVVQKCPDLPAQLFRLFADARMIARRHATAIPSHTLACRSAYLEAEAREFGGDPWRHGLKANQHVIEKFISYCYDQGIAARRIKAEELFHPSTWSLVEAETEGA